jgi:Cysteine-rich domain/Domain of unknown function (DUF3390)
MFCDRSDCYDFEVSRTPLMRGFDSTPSVNIYGKVPAMEVALMIPCYIDAFYPQVGIATLELLERLGVDVVYPKEQTCCGQSMSNPTLYQIATTSVSTALDVLPHFAIYNKLNAWGKHRDVPEAAPETLHEWYKNHRLKGNEVLGL